MNRRKHRFQIGDRVMTKPWLSSVMPAIGTITKIDRRRIRPYNISGQYIRYSPDDLMECFDPNSVLKKMIDN